MQKEIHDKTGHAGGAQVQVEPFKELVGERWREEAEKSDCQLQVKWEAFPN